MRKKILAAIIVLIAAVGFAYADTTFEAGPVLEYNGPPVIDGIAPYSGIYTTDFSLGIDSRLNFGLFQLSGALLFTPGTEVGNYNTTYYVYFPSLELQVDAGFNFTIADIVGINIGVGPTVSVILGYSDSNGNKFMYTGTSPVIALNAKASIDFLVGTPMLSIGYILNYYPDTTNLNSAVTLSFLFK